MNNFNVGAPNTQCFSIHGLVSFEVTDSGPKLLRGWNPLYQEYSNHKFTPSSDCDLAISFGPFIPRVDGNKVYDDVFFTSPGYLYCSRDSYKWTSWTFDFQENGDEKALLRIHTDLGGNLVAPGHVVEPLIGAISASRGNPFLHAAGVLSDGKAILFSGRGGSGKSSIAMRLANAGYPYLSDDRVIVRNGAAFGVWSSINLFSYNVPDFIRYRLGGTKLFDIASRELLHRLSRGQIKLYVKVNPRALFERLASTAPIGQLYLIHPSDRLAITHRDRSSALKSIILNEQLESTLAMRYFLTAAYADAPGILARHWDRYAKAIGKALPSTIRYYDLDLPRNLQTLRTEDLVDFLGIG